MQEKIHLNFVVDNSDLFHCFVTIYTSFCCCCSVGKCARASSSLSSSSSALLSSVDKRVMTTTIACYRQWQWNVTGKNQFDVDCLNTKFFLFCFVAALISFDSLLFSVFCSATAHWQLLFVNQHIWTLSVYCLELCSVGFLYRVRPMIGGLSYAISIACHSVPRQYMMLHYQCHHKRNTMWCAHNTRNKRAAICDMCTALYVYCIFVILPINFFSPTRCLYVCVMCVSWTGFAYHFEPRYFGICLSNISFPLAISASLGCVRHTNAIKSEWNLTLMCVVYK